MGLGPVHILVFAVIAILLLGGGRFSNMMGDVAKGVKNFKKGMSEDDDVTPPSRIQSAPSPAPAPAPVVEAERTTEER